MTASPKFIKRYNAAIDKFSKEIGKNVGNVKIKVMTPANGYRYIELQDESFGNSSMQFGFGNFFPLLPEDEDIDEISYFGENRYGSEPNIGHYAILYATLRAFPELDNVDVMQILREISASGSYFSKSLEENGLSISISRVGSQINFSVENIELRNQAKKRSEEEYRKHQEE